MPAELVELAPAKINLALHVVGQRADGYHLLETIVTFADIGDRLMFSASGEDRLTVSGPFSGALTANLDDNLVIRARNGLRSQIEAAGGSAPSVAIHLEKHLPVASGIGGGSADAAATLRGLLRFWQVEDHVDDIAKLALSLGADVPMCFRGEPVMARGIGEELSPLPDLPSLPLVLGNPLCGVSTPTIFSRLASKQNSPIGDITSGDWVDRLSCLRNDLEVPAQELVPEIRDITAMIAGQGALLTRMSGSGATCFGIFASREEADQAAQQLSLQRPDWYFKTTTTLAGADA